MDEDEINQQWRRIVNTMNEGLMLVGTDGSIVMANQAFEEMTGYRAEEILGRPCTLLQCDVCEGKRLPGEPFWCILFEKKTDIRCRCGIKKKTGAFCRF